MVRITTAGTVTNYTDPGGGIAEPTSIVVGPDGALWFTNIYGDASIGRIDPATKAVTHFHTPDAIPKDIATGSDGALWFTAPATHENTIWRMTIDGASTPYTVGGVAWPQDIVTGPDGALWFTHE